MQQMRSYRVSSPKAGHRRRNPSAAPPMHHADRVLRANTSETTRVETFSEAVFAISMTLLGLTLKVPRPEPNEPLLLALAREWPEFLAVVTSFVTISIVWINHHRLFTSAGSATA